MGCLILYPVNDELPEFCLAILWGWRLKGYYFLDFVRAWLKLPAWLKLTWRDKDFIKTEHAK